MARKSRHKCWPTLQQTYPLIGNLLKDDGTGAELAAGPRPVGSSYDASLSSGPDAASGRAIPLGCPCRSKTARFAGRTAQISAVIAIGEARNALWQATIDLVDYSRPECL